MRHGHQERVFRLEFVSNQEFSELEYNKWIEATVAADITMPPQERVKEKQADIKEAIGYEFNEQDVERIVSTIISSLLISCERISNLHFISRFEKKGVLNLIPSITL